MNKEQLGIYDPVGDISSPARGSGARFNQGKPKVELLPLTFIARSFGGVFDSDISKEQTLVRAILYEVGLFQSTGDIAYIDTALSLANGRWEDCARVLEFGAIKYAPWNWAKGMNWSICLGCIGRHSLKVMAEEELNDKDSGLPHIGHIMANLVFLRTYWTGFPEGNDLPPKNFEVEKSL